MIAHFPERLTPEQRIPDEMAPTKVIVHANSETHELEVESFSDLKEKVIALIGLEDIDLKINNKIMDEKTEFESKVHVDVTVKFNVDGMFNILLMNLNLSCNMYNSIPESTQDLLQEVESDLASMRFQETCETLKKEVDELKKKMKSHSKEFLALADLRAEDQKQMKIEKEKLRNELLDIRRQLNDTQRQVTKLSLIFNGRAVTRLLNQRRGDELYFPMIDLLEQKYDIKIEHFEIGDVHPLPRPTKDGKPYGFPSIIVKFNARHGISSYK